MAKFMSYDVYEINLHNVRNDADLKYLLLQTTKNSLLVIEDLDRHLEDKSMELSLSGVLNFMDEIFFCCGEERVMVFTMNNKENVCASILRPGRIDVHINFPIYDFTAFKNWSRQNLALQGHSVVMIADYQRTWGMSAQFIPVKDYLSSTLKTIKNGPAKLGLRDRIVTAKESSGWKECSASNSSAGECLPALKQCWQLCA
ncbi:AAA-ATPase At2g46620-like [Salvia miltiorrhiza]|uniref:AAA-ATPase At2g46620-like n=1 Tax=Salvia miltiorrhiza TaxID=226208 RepID=UPI0025AB6332|nr:AAA-ATPase At2g46620-like [Salvia miltiorrhiza]